MNARRRTLRLITSMPASAILSAGSFSFAMGAEPSRNHVRLVVNDIQPSALLGRIPFHILSCKDLVQLRNAFVGLTSEQVSNTPEFASLYVRVRARYTQLVTTYRTALNDLESSWSSSELETLKRKRAEYLFLIVLEII